MPALRRGDRRSGSRYGDVTFRLGLGVAAAAWAVDQVTKRLLGDLIEAAGGRLAVTSFLNLVNARNEGISFSLFREFGAAWGRWILVALALAIVVGIVVWLHRTDRAWPAAGLGLIIGGALGNAYDRAAWGAVTDLFDFHLAGFHWPTFNPADTAIFVGVALLIVDSLFQRQRTPKK